MHLFYCIFTTPSNNGEMDEFTVSGKVTILVCPTANWTHSKGTALVLGMKIGEAREENTSS